MNTNRIERERHTLRVMIGIYCRDWHGSTGRLCPDCQALHEYAMQRIDHCPLIEDKPTCAQCPIHCYRKDKREMVRQVMRHAGPRMLLSHPFLTIMHLLDERKKRETGRAGRSG